MIITIDKKTPSINHLHLHRGYHMFLTKEARELKEYIHTCCLPYDSERYKDKHLMVHVKIYENWLTKKNEVARKDISNREKFLIDSIFDSLGLNDKFIFYHTMQKVQSNEEKAVVEIGVYI